MFCVDKISETIDLKDSDDSDDDKEQLGQAFLEGECSELGIKLNYLANKFLPDYFEKSLIKEHIQEFSKQLKNEASCLSAWRIIFQQLNIITLFLHTLIHNPLPKHFKNAKEFNQVQHFAHEIITLRAHLLVTANGEHDIYFFNGEKNFYEQQVTMRFLDPPKLAAVLAKTMGPDLNHSGPEHYKALNSFINRVCSAMRMVRYALEIIDKQLIYVDTATLQDHLPLVKQSFYFYDEAILDADIPNFLKIDLYDAKKKAFIDSPDRENFSDAAAADYFKELLICELFAYEGFNAVLAPFINPNETLPVIAPEYRRELKLQVENEENLRKLSKDFDVSVGNETNKQALSIYLYFDYATFFIDAERIKHLDEKAAVTQTTGLLWDIKYNIDCLAFIINCLRQNVEIYQHREHDAHYKTLSEHKKPWSSLPKPIKVEAEEKKIFNTSMKEPLENLQRQIDLLRSKKQEFYDLYNPAIAHRAVKSQPKRETKLSGFKTSIVNTVMLELERTCLKIDALKFTFYSEEALKEFSSYVEKIAGLQKLADKIILDITTACQCWNIVPKSTPAPAPLKRRYSDNAVLRKTKTERTYTPRSAKSLTPPDSPPEEIEITIQAMGMIEAFDTCAISTSIVSDAKDAELAISVLIHVDSLGDVSTQIFKHLASLDVTTTDTSSVTNAEPTSEEKISETQPLEEPVAGVIISDDVLDAKELQEEKISETQPLEEPIAGVIISDNVLDAKELQEVNLPSLNGKDAEANKATYPSIRFFAPHPIALIGPYWPDIFENVRKEFPQYRL